MQFYDVIKSRNSIKSFTSTPIQEDKLSRIINAAMMSPSWKNNASFKFILVNDKREKEALGKAVMNDADNAATAIIQAPMVAVVVAQPSHSGMINDKEFYLVDGAIAMEHFVLAATNEGYGTCWIASLDEEQVRKTLFIPTEYRVVAMTPIGETNEQEDHHEKKDVREHVFLNRWNEGYTENHPNIL